MILCHSGDLHPINDHQRHGVLDGSRLTLSRVQSIQSGISLAPHRLSFLLRDDGVNAHIDDVRLNGGVARAQMAVNSRKHGESD
jgi:hypothetical protein